jgi:hypothetical protein
MDPTIANLTDERDTYLAQRDHYLSHCTTLQSQLDAAESQLRSKFQTSQCKVDAEIFEGESLERLKEWRRVLEWVIEEEERKEEGKEGKEGKRESEGEEGKGKGRRHGTELPFSSSNLTGFLTKNHQLTQGRTQYPEPRPKNN